MTGIFKKKKSTEIEDLKAQVAKLIEEKEKKQIQQEIKEDKSDEISIDEDVEYESEPGDDLQEEAEEDKVVKPELNDKDKLYQEMGKYLYAALNLYIDDITSDESK